MANVHETEREVFYTFTKYEAANIIALLAAQLGDVNIKGNYSGACPDIKVNNKRIYFVLE